MEITNPVLFRVLAEKHKQGASAAGSKKRPFPWVGSVAPFLSSKAASSALQNRLREALGVSATLLAIVVAALI